MSHQQPHSTLQFRNLVHQRARQNEPLSNEEVAQITRETAELAGVNQPLEEPTQTQWLESANNALHKPASAITKEDAKNVHRQEMKAFQSMPSQGSVASVVQSQADRNED